VSTRPAIPHFEMEQAERTIAPRFRRWSTGARRPTVVAVFLIGVHLLVRAGIAATGVLSQDDLVVTGRSARLPLFSREFLLPDDGRFAPLAHLLTGSLTQWAPLEYWPMAVTLLLFQALASLAVLRLLRTLLGDRPVLLLPLLLYLFSPLTLAAFDSWSTAVGAVPLQAALAWVCTDAIRLGETGRRRYALTGTLVFVVALALGGGAVVVPVVAVAVLAVALSQAGEAAPLLAALRRGAWLWAGLLITAGAFALQFWSALVPRTVSEEQSGSLADAVDAVRLTVFEGILPALVGGPLSWSGFGSWADPPTTAVVGAVVVALVLVGWASWRRKGCGMVWVLLGAYIGTSVVLLVIQRLTTGLPAEFGLTLRYFADVGVIATIAVALVARAPARDIPRRQLLDRQERRDLAVLTAVFFVGFSLWSTAAYTQVRDTGSTREYLANAKESLFATERPLLDHAVPDTVVWDLAAPYNRISWVFAPLGVETATSTDGLVLLDPAGRLVDGQVSDEYSLFPGPVPECGHFVEGTSPTGILLNGSVSPGEWIVQLNYLASRDGWIEVSFRNGDPLRVPIRDGLNNVYMTLSGGGDSLSISTHTQDLALCVDTGLVGFLEPVD
jgi:hypothetical protein